MLSFLFTAVKIAIIWSNTFIEVPLNQALDQYKTLPEAILYIDGKLANDPLMYYEYEVHHTTFSVINTKIVGTYTVIYKVYFPTYFFSQEETIYFNVVDQTAPTIVVDSNLYLDVGTKAPDFTKMVTIYDNYYNPKDLILTVDTNLLNMNIKGTYNVTYKLRDPSFNERTFIQKVHIVDRVAPVIKLKNQITLKIKETIDLNKYFTFEDNYDKTLIVNYDDKHINYNLVGEYTLIVYAKDQSGNESFIETIVFIVDNEAPLITLKVPTIEINYKDTLSIEELRSYILRVTDNVDTLLIENVEIISYVDSSVLGTYDVKYEIIDSNNLVGTTTLRVKVSDLEKPKIDLIEEIVVDVKTLEPYILDYLHIYDNYDHRDDLNVQISGKVDMSKIGEYRVIVVVKDRAKNETVMPIVVEVVDRIPPVVEAPNIFTIINFTKPNYVDLINATDNYDKDIEIKVFDEEITYSIIGDYNVKIIATDQSGNETIIYLLLEIRDVIDPEIVLTTNRINISYEQDSIDYYSYIEDVYDNYDKDLTVEDVLIYSSVNLNIKGLYQAIYSLKDKSNNTTSEILYIQISDFIPPIITVVPITIKAGDVFDYLKYGNAYDEYDKDISHLLKVNPNFIPTNTPGFYEVIYYVHDSSGNYSEVRTLLTIETKDKWKDYVSYGLGVVLIASVLIGFYLYKKRSMKF